MVGAPESHADGCELDVIDASVSHTYPRNTMAIISWLTPTSKTQTKKKKFKKKTSKGIFISAQ